VIDEAHVFAPSAGAASRNRPRRSRALHAGAEARILRVLATQRISKLHKDAAAELLNKLIGRTGLDVDVKRAGDELGFDKESAAASSRAQAGRVLRVRPGDRAEIQLVRTGDVVTTHPEAGHAGSAPPPAPTKVRAVLAQLAGSPEGSGGGGAHDRRAAASPRSATNRPRVRAGIRISARSGRRD
jgi:hypothetical protein